MRLPHLRLVGLLRHVSAFPHGLPPESVHKTFPQYENDRKSAAHFLKLVERYSNADDDWTE